MSLSFFMSGHLPGVHVDRWRQTTTPKFVNESTITLTLYARLSHFAQRAGMLRRIAASQGLLAGRCSSTILSGHCAPSRATHSQSSSPPPTQTAAIRAAFVDYFANHASMPHKRVTASSLVPSNDPSLLFVNAGMVQFKDVFTGAVPPTTVAAAPGVVTGAAAVYNDATAVTVQPCVRAGGKHNDLDNVGYTLRHHTLFEMLGNFSFGAYGREEAIVMAWHFVTEVLCLPKHRLRVTTFTTDEASRRVWASLGVTEANGGMVVCGAEDNFWQMVRRAANAFEAHTFTHACTHMRTHVLACRPYFSLFSFPSG
jgi:hypothetical protein